MPPLLRVEKLQKSYGEIRAVEEVSFEVNPGEILGLLGPNGAGKTTTIGCICGLLEPDSGTVDIGDDPVASRPLEARRKLGVVPQDLALYEELTVEANLLSFGGLYRMSSARLVDRIKWCLEFVQLADSRDKRVAQLSGGMKRRLNLAVALMHDPELVLADEPTVGVDPQSRSHIFENMEALARAGKAVVYTTHYMEEVERLCARAAIIDRGKVAAMDEVPALLDLAGKARRVRLGWTGGIIPEEERRKLEERFSPSAMSVEGAELHLAFDGPVPVTGMTAWLAAEGHELSVFSMERPTLEDAFLKLTGRRLRDR